MMSRHEVLKFEALVEGEEPLGRVLDQILDTDVSARRG